ncbi:hypothetical protein CONCODRAFT_80670 [Conidiobolus coronatus NRRL 28638]|uniref:Transcription factor domain-containing protein n=1 Tax=Conidiobolus coronatus (strain ATCC 28846 / CBS 209.66 / NRRL 28638) TaxID=796925 RepID=A0A137NT11_CONC2|nr:hypothetical protein CONCODRAFT_80670 [Conidiobolus coronatus NRRL 28638]|eukprot:KXN65849.1 hypothetical protein CONCODRAFT_80670 [Conidiobolus coronatus NRRL 28638]
MASSIGYSNNITHCKFFLTQAVRIAYSLGLHRQIPKNRTRATKSCNDGLRANVWNILICYDITEVYYRNSEYSPTCVSSGIISNNGYIPLNLSYLHKFELPREKVPNESMFWYQKRSPSSSPNTNSPQDDHYNSTIDEVQPKCLYLFRYIIEKFVLPISYHIRKISTPNSNNDYLNPEALGNQIKLVNLSLDSAYVFGLKHYSGLSYNYQGDQLAPTIITPFVWGFVLMLKSFSIIVNSLRPHCNLNASSPLPPNQLKNLLLSSKQLAHITSLYPPNFVSFRYIYIIRAATILFQEYPYLPLSAQPELRNSLKIIYEQIYLSSNNYAPFKDLLPKLKNLGLKLGFDISAEIE